MKKSPNYNDLLEDLVKVQEEFYFQTSHSKLDYFKSGVLFEKKEVESVNSLSIKSIPPSSGTNQLINLRTASDTLCVGSEPKPLQAVTSTNSKKSWDGGLVEFKKSSFAAMLDLIETGAIKRISTVQSRQEAAYSSYSTTTDRSRRSNGSSI